MPEMATKAQLKAAYGDLKFVPRQASPSPIPCVLLLPEPPKQSAQDVQNVSKDPSAAPLPHVAKHTYME